MPPLDASGSEPWLAGSVVGETPKPTATELHAAFGARVLIDVETVTGFDVDGISKRGRSAKRATARKAAIWLLIEVGGLTYSATGRLLGRDHTTIMFAHRHAMEDLAARWVIEAVLNQRGNFEVVPPAHGGTMLL